MTLLCPALSGEAFSPLWMCLPAMFTERKSAVNRTSANKLKLRGADREES
jgi:hypothetical protein